MFIDEKRIGEQATKPEQQGQQPDDRAHHSCGSGCCPTKGYGLRKTLRGWW